MRKRSAGALGIATTGEGVQPFAAPSGSWQLVGPVVGNVPDTASRTGRVTTNSGRITSLAVAPTCQPGNCRVYVGAAGGGVFRTDDALATTPTWTPSSKGLTSNAIGSLLVDPSDASGATLYAGTGEPNGSSDSEAGVGLFKSTNGGDSWTLVSGSVAAAKDRSIAGIAIDPADATGGTIYIGTAVARHGSSSVNGGRFTPPGAPQVGLYKSTDGGATFSLVFSRPSDPVNPASPNGSDFFRGGVAQLALDRTGLTAGQATRVFVALFDYGVYRSSPVDEGGSDASYKRVFTSAGAGAAGTSSGSRTMFALAPRTNVAPAALRLYVGDTDGSTPSSITPNGGAEFYRVDNVDVPATSLTTSSMTNTGYMQLSSPTKGTTGYDSFNFCTGQCSYDMAVASPAGQPDTVYLLGSYQYDELGHESNARAVQRSTNSGVSFTDMTQDTQSSPQGIHPDQHAIVFDPNNFNIWFEGSDGGLVRSDGLYTDRSSDCNSRKDANGNLIAGADLTDCRRWLSAIPTTIFSLDAGLATLQFQSVSLNPQDPTGDLLGGTQDNGTWAFTSTVYRNFNGSAIPGPWFETITGDGGQSGVDAVNPQIRFHSFFNAVHDVNFKGDDILGWDYVSDPLQASGEQQSFYTPIIADPRVGGTIFDGLQHVWRTKDDGGPRSYLDSNCNEFFGAFARGTTCGDFVPLGGASGNNTPGDLTGSVYGTDKGGSYVVAVERTRSDTGTMWVATRRGRVFVSKNAADPAAAVIFTRIDTAAQPTRFISGITIDPADPNHAFVSYSGYSAYAPGGHVYEVRYDPTLGTATWTDRSYDIGDQPVTALRRDDPSGDLYASTDFGVLRLPAGGTNWITAATGLPPVATYGLTIDTTARVLYAATHGRAIWKLQLEPVAPGGGGGNATPELGSAELLATGLVPIVAILLYQRRRTRRTSKREDEEGDDTIQ